jgi:hypothetical protein
MADLEYQLQNNGRDFAETLSDRDGRWQDTMAAMEGRHAKALQTIADQETDLQRKTEDRLADLTTSYDERRLSAQEKRAAEQTAYQQRRREATTAAEKRRLDEQHAAAVLREQQDAARLTREQTTAQGRIERDAAEAKAILDRRRAEEDASYLSAKAAALTRHTQDMDILERENREKVEALQRRIREENAKYAGQQSDLQRTYGEDVAALQQRHAQAVAALEDRRGKENTQYDNAKAKITEVYDHDISEEERRHATVLVKTQEHLDEVNAQYQQASDRRQAALDADLTELNRRHEREVRDLAENVGDFDKKLAKARADVLATQPPPPADDLQVWRDLGIAADDTRGKIDALREYLVKLARETPFTLEQVLKQAQQLITVGIDPTRVVTVLDSQGQVVSREFSKITADWVAAMSSFGPQAQEAVLNVFRYLQGGRIGEAFENLRQLGINPADLEKLGLLLDQQGHVIGTSVQNLARNVAQGWIAAGHDQATALTDANALIEQQGPLMTGVLSLIQQRFKGVAADQSATMLGVVSNFQDLFQEMQRIAGGPLFERLRDALKDLYDQIGSEEGHAQLVVYARLIGDTVGGAFAAVIQAAQQLIPVFLGLKKAGDDDLSPLARNILGVTDAVGALASFLGTHGDEIKGAIIAIGAALAAVGVAAFVASLTNPVTGLIAVVGLLGAAWGANWGDIQGKTKVVVDWLQDVALPAIGGFLGRAGEQFDYLVTEIAQATALVSRALREGVAGWGALFDAFGTTLREAVDGWGAGFDALGTAVRGAVDTVGDLFDRLGTTVHDASSGRTASCRGYRGAGTRPRTPSRCSRRRSRSSLRRCSTTSARNCTAWLYEDPGFVGGWLGRARGDRGRPSAPGSATGPPSSATSLSDLGTGSAPGCSTRRTGSCRGGPMRWGRSRVPSAPG